jgi:hypothetical protein
MKLYQSLFGFLLSTVSCLSSGQSTSAVTQQPTSDVGHPVLFGTNVNLEASPSTKGAQLGLGAYQQKKNPKKKRSEANSQSPLSHS